MIDLRSVIVIYDPSDVHDSCGNPLTVDDNCQSGFFGIVIFNLRNNALNPYTISFANLTYSTEIVMRPIFRFTT